MYYVHHNNLVQSLDALWEALLWKTNTSLVKGFVLYLDLGAKNTIWQNSPLNIHGNGSHVQRHHPSWCVLSVVVLSCCWCHHHNNGRQKRVSSLSRLCVCECTDLLKKKGHCIDVYCVYLLYNLRGHWGNWWLFKIKQPSWVAYLVPGKEEERIYQEVISCSLNWPHIEHRQSFLTSVSLLQIPPVKAGTCSLWYGNETQNYSKKGGIHVLGVGGVGAEGSGQGWGSQAV